MESNDAFSQHDAAGAGALASAARPRRMSMEEDMLYRDLMTSRPAKPPSYESSVKAVLAAERRAAVAAAASCDAASRNRPLSPRDVLPKYSCDVNVEGVFMRKMELEDTIKRAEYRTWQMVYVELRGTMLNVYQVKKERGWWATKPEGPDISPDAPPWVKKGTLEKSYNLMHADAGIAADYRKRKYVIRLRVETEQFLLSCVELKTFVRWLDRIFAAIDVAAPLDERDFPRDQSIPRIQRLRWLRGQRPRPQGDSSGPQPHSTQERSDLPRVVPGTHNTSNVPENAIADDDDEDGEEEDGQDGHDDESTREANGHAHPPIPPTAASRHPASGRLSTSSYPNEHLDPDTGKWMPRSKWTETHDQLYAKLCYAVLLFKSPRKSNYVVSRGKRWYVDWDSGRMVRVLPPAYGEVDLWGPWQVIAPENRLI